MAFLVTRLSLLSRKCGPKKCLILLITLCILWLIIAKYLRVNFPSISRRSHLESGIHNGEPQIDVIRITEKLGQKNLSKDHGEYMLVLPKKIESNQASGIDIYKDIHHLTEILQSFQEYDGATCHALKHDPSQDHPQKLKSCWFKARNWTMLISGPNGKNYHRHGKENRPWLWICNMVEFPFVIRQSVFNRIGGLNQSYGEATLLDFFLRSNGTLKIAVSQKCVFTKNQSNKYQEQPETKRQIYLDYGLLGYTHNILRIIRPDSITWTKCSFKNTSCPDIPEQQTRVDNILLPYCCKTLINQILVHTVHALNQIGIENRVGFGTLLGAIRSKTIIPWTVDADICMKTEDTKKQTFERLKEALKPTNFSYAYLRDKHRIVPLNAFVKHISNHALVSESDLFSEQVLRYMQEMLPIPGPLWTRAPYLDFYKYDKIFQRGNINVTIDGLEYSTGGKPHELLREWFGSRYMSTDHKDRITSGVAEKTPLLEKVIRLFQI